MTAKITQNDTLDTIVENLFYVLPIIHKRLLKIDPPDVSRDIRLSRLHLGIMGMLNNEGCLPISEAAKKFIIAKPQMTHLINQLPGPAWWKDGRTPGTEGLPKSPSPKKAKQLSNSAMIF
jgi:hypothetical protein